MNGVIPDSESPPPAHQRPEGPAGRKNHPDQNADVIVAGGTEEITSMANTARHPWDVWNCQARCVKFEEEGGGSVHQPQHKERALERDPIASRRRSVGRD